MIDDTLDFLDTVGTQPRRRICWVRDCDNTATQRISYHVYNTEYTVWLCDKCFDRFLRDGGLSEALKCEPIESTAPPNS